MNRADPQTGVAARPARLAIVISDPTIRSRVTAELVLEGFDVMVTALLEDVREGMPTVTDRTFGFEDAGHPPGPRPATLSAVAMMRDPAGRLRIVSHVPIAGIGVPAIVRAANGLFAGPDRPSG